jgi:hypothetical protein
VAPPTIPKKTLYRKKIMNKILKQIDKLKSDLVWWEAKLNKSRKNSLRAMRAMHVNAIRKEINRLQVSLLGELIS